MKKDNLGKKVNLINHRKLTKPAALCLSALLFISMLAFFATSVQGATATSLGNTTTGTLFDQNDANAQSISYFTATTSGTITDINAYIAGAYSGNAITALYAVNGNTAAALLEQSNPANIGTTFTWTDFQLPTPYTVTAGTTYGLAIMGNIPVNIMLVSGTGQRDHNGVSTYTKGFANPFGNIWGTDNTGAMSIYATGTTSTTIPPSTPTAAPTATPTPTPTNTPTPPATQTPTSSNFGNAATDNYISQNDANAQSISYFTATTSGTITDINAYIAGAYSGNAITALYAVNGNTAAALLEQSNPANIGTTFTWTDFQLPTPYTVTAGTTYGLAIMGNIPVNIMLVSGTGQRDHNGVSTYTKGFANPFGNIWGTDNTGAMSIYATGTTSTTIPPSTPTAAPTATPTPTPTNTPTPPATQTPTSSNLAPFPSSWVAPMIGGTSAGWSAGFVYGSINSNNDILDNSVLYNGQATIRIDRHTSGDSNIARENDGPWIAIKPGDQVVFSCLVKTSASSFGDTNPYSGARIGIDYYANGVITGSASSDGAPIWTPSGGFNDGYSNYVHWGTSTWTKITISFRVASTYPACNAYGSPYPNGQMVMPTGIIPWMQVWSSTYGASDNGQAWFANPQLTITS